MSNPTIRIHNIETNEIIDREMTDAEFAQYQSDQAKREAEAKAKAAAEANRAQALAKLGLDEDDLKALGL